MTIENKDKETLSVQSSSISWDEIINKPTRFAPLEHEHDIRWKDVVEKPAEFTPEYHTHDEYAKRYHKHTIEDIIGIEGLNLGNGGTIGPDHNHDIRYYTKSQIDAMYITKADVDHTHSIKELTDLEEFLETYKRFTVDQNLLIEDSNGFFTYQLEHDLGTNLLDVIVKDINYKELLVDVTILSENRIEIFTSMKEDLIVLIKKINLN